MWCPCVGTDGILVLTYVTLHSKILQVLSSMLILRFMLTRLHSNAFPVRLHPVRKTVFQYFILGNNNIHTNVLQNGEQHVNIWL